MAEEFMAEGFKTLRDSKAKRTNVRGGLIFMIDFIFRKEHNPSAHQTKHVLALHHMLLVEA